MSHNFMFLGEHIFLCAIADMPQILVYLGIVYLPLSLISVPSLVYLGISVPWAGIPRTMHVVRLRIKARN